MNVTPASVTLEGGQSQQFKAKYGNSQVSWSLSPGTGTISSSGVYTAPSVVSSQQTITVLAQSSNKSGKAYVTLQPVVVAISPSSATLTSAQILQFAAAVTGTANTAVAWSLSAPVGTLSSTGLYTAPSSITSTQSVTIMATSAADPTKTANALLTLSPQTAPAISISVSPGTTNLTASQTQQFTAAVAGTTNTAVTWSLNPAVGTISSVGLYTAPSSITWVQSVTVTATSAACTTQSASATVTLNPLLSVSITPGSTTLGASQAQQFTASVTGTTNTAVAWSLNPAVGTISSAGLYTAPFSVPSTQSVYVSAASVADPTKSATSVITLMPVVALQWNASTSADISGYNVYRSGVSGGPYSRVNPALIAETSFIDSSVQSNTEYYYVATAVDILGVESAYSTEAQILVQ